jgi:hypothetical protein
MRLLMMAIRDNEGNTMNMTNEAKLGYANPAAACPYLSTSNSSDAWHIGAWLNRSGRSAPHNVRKSRGYTFHVNDMKVQIRYANNATYIERIA